MKVIGAFVLAAMLMACSGCAMITGTVTGAFTGAVDLPAETYRQNRLAFEQHPMLYGVDCLIVAPCGIVGGPVVGLVKGVSLDIEWVCGKMGYGVVFGSYREASIWRPWTINWSSPAPVNVANPPNPVNPVSQ
jgi:hypothetical protein